MVSYSKYKNAFKNIFCLVLKLTSFIRQPFHSLLAPTPTIFTVKIGAVNNVM